MRINVHDLALIMLVGAQLRHHVLLARSMIIILQWLCIESDSLIMVMTVIYGGLLAYLIVGSTEGCSRVYA